MSAQHPIISITGSSGAGTTSVKAIFELIFRRENVVAAYIEGDAFHRYDRAAMKARIAEMINSGHAQMSGLRGEMMRKFGGGGRWGGPRSGGGPR